MFDFAITGLSTLFIASAWSKLRYDFFDLFCYIAAFVGALIVPALAARYFPMLEEVGGAPVDAGGALIGCLLYDHFFSSRR